MPKVILQVYPTLGNEQEMTEMRPIGRNNDAYQRMLGSVVEIAQAADDLGYWGIAHVEHHLHSEGLEMSPAPLFLNVHAAHHTKRINHGQLGLVLPTHDPVRLAEEIAITDHMLKGRLFVGMARGYQSRWTNILGQKVGVTATASDQSEADERNRLLFAENYKIMKAAWTEELLTYDGPTYQIPYPYEGIPGWPVAKTITAKWGAPGEVDDEGTVKAVSVCPRPYSSPHPQLFQAFGASPATLQWCGEEDVMPTIMFGALEGLKDLVGIYVDAQASKGRTIDPGQRAGVCRSFHILPNGMSEDAARAEALRMTSVAETTVWQGWYEQFGVTQGALRHPGEEGWIPQPGETMAERLINSGMVLAGTVDMVKRQVERLLDAVPFEYLVWLFHYGIIPKDEAFRSLELLATEVLPEFGFEAPAEAVSVA